MRISPVVLLAGAAAALGVVLLSQSKASAASGDGGGGGSPPDPAKPDPAACAQLEQSMAAKGKALLTELRLLCIQTPNDPGCSMVQQAIDLGKAYAPRIASCNWQSPSSDCKAAMQELQAKIQALTLTFEAACKAHPSAICDKITQAGASMQADAQTYLSQCHPDWQIPTPGKSALAAAPSPLTGALFGISMLFAEQVPLPQALTPQGAATAVDLLSGNIGDLLSGFGSGGGSDGGVSSIADDNCAQLHATVQALWDKIGTLDPNSPADAVTMCVLYNQGNGLSNQAYQMGCDNSDWGCPYGAVTECDQLQNGQSGGQKWLVPPTIPQTAGACPPGYDQTADGNCKWGGVQPNADGSCNAGFDIGDDGWCHLLSGVNPSDGLTTDKCQALTQAYQTAVKAYDDAAQGALSDPVLAATLPGLAATRDLALTAAQTCIAGGN